jgi:transcriptional regulator with XRE-family HTH domain
MGVLEVAKKKLTGETFGERLRCARENAGLTQLELADKTGIHRVNLNRYENDKVLPVVDVAHSLAETLGVTVEDLMGARG